MCVWKLHLKDHVQLHVPDDSCAFLCLTEACMSRDCINLMIHCCQHVSMALSEDLEDKQFTSTIYITSGEHCSRSKGCAEDQPQHL